MISILCWKWKGDAAYRSQFGPDHVNTLFSMLQRNLTLPFQLFCITDDPRGLAPGIKPFPLWPAPGVLLSPKRPNCYRRLRMYSREAREWFGERIVSIDLDCVIVSNIDDIFSRQEDFIAWTKRIPGRPGGVPYQGSLISHRTGTRPQLWEEFNPDTSPELGRARGFCGSDQAWVSAKLPPNEAVWTEHDGIYSFKGKVRREGLPKNARIIMFHGVPDPWHPGLDIEHPWIKEHYR